MNSTVQTSTKSFTLQVFETVRAEILTGEIPPGSKLRIAEAADRFNVSRSAIREALSRLVASGLVEAIDQRGFRVTAISKEDLIDLTQARVEIESLVLRKAIELGDRAWESAILAAHHDLTGEPKFGASEDEVLERWHVLHERFHHALVAACNSKWLLDFRDRLSDQSRRYRALSYYEAVPRNHDDEHKEIMEAAISRDAKRAVKLMEQHILKTTEIVLQGARWNTLTSTAA